jgi:hypothetical protein
LIDETTRPLVEIHNLEIEDVVKPAEEPAAEEPV